MKQLRLDLDRLAVETFATGDTDEAARGTVRAHEYTIQTQQCGSCMNASCFTSCSPGGDPRCTCPVYL